MESEFNLDKEELESALWKKLEEHLKKKLDDSRKMNDSIHSSIEETMFIRGGIAVCKGMLRLNPENEDI